MQYLIKRIILKNKEAQSTSQTFYQWAFKMYTDITSNYIWNYKHLLRSLYLVCFAGTMLSPACCNLSSLAWFLLVLRRRGSLRSKTSSITDVENKDTGKKPDLPTTYSPWQSLRQAEGPSSGSSAASMLELYWGQQATLAWHYRDLQDPVSLL